MARKAPVVVRGVAHRGTLRGVGIAGPASLFSDFNHETHETHEKRNREARDRAPCAVAEMELLREELHPASSWHLNQLAKSACR
jgi:hypothetical protein